MDGVVKRPIITEKSFTLASNGWYTFRVDQDASKEVIASEIKRLYAVDVIAVRTMRMHGKMRRAGKRVGGVKRPDWKKALVQLKKGQRIDAFDITPTGEAQGV